MLAFSDPFCAGEYFECTVADRTSLVGPFAYLITKLASGSEYGIVSTY